jgi:hypothetical protein
MKPGGFHNELDSAHRRIPSYTPHHGGNGTGCEVWAIGATAGCRVAPSSYFP